MKMSQTTAALAAILVTTCLTPTRLAISGPLNWPQFRGPEGRSIAPEQKLPDTFGPDENLKWKTPLPPGHSSPCIWGDRIFLTGYEELTLKMLCFRRSDGRLLWEETRRIDELPRYSHEASSPATPTPCTDGRRVCFLFGDYGLVVLDMKGQLIWEKRFMPANSEFGYGASPALGEGKLLINCDGGIQPSLLCLDLETGDTLWQMDRPNTYISHATPYIWSRGEAKEVLQGGSGTLTAYDLRSGTELWRVSNLPGVVCPSPVADEEAVYYGAWSTAHVGGRSRVASLFGEEVGLSDNETQDAEAFYRRFDRDKDHRLSVEELPPSRARDAFNFIDRDQSGYWEFAEFAPAFQDTPRWTQGVRNVMVSITAGGKGDISESHVRWESTNGLPYVASPLLYRNRLYYVKNGGFVTCVDPSSGRPHFERTRLGVSGEYYASPIGVGNEILFAAKKGAIVILKAGDAFEIDTKVDLPDGIYATPAVVDNHLYVRTAKHLWAFGE